MRVEEHHSAHLLDDVYIFVPEVADKNSEICKTPIFRAGAK